MPSVIILKDDRKQVSDIHLLIVEEDFPIEAVQLIQNQVKAFIKDNPSYTKEELITIAEEITDEYNGSLVNFKLYLVSY